MITVLLALYLFAAPAEVKSLYECSGTSPDGKTYKVTLQTRQNGESLLFIWGGGTQMGVGVRQGDKIAVAFLFLDRDPNVLAVIVYTISEVGLEGVWSPGGVLLKESCVLPNAAKA